MICVDTNVLLRYVLDDDPRQSPRSAELFSGEAKILITDVVLAEALWTLAGKKYKVSREDLLDLIEALFAEPVIEFEDKAVVWRSLGDFRTTEADFQDALILRKAEHLASVRQEMLTGFFTFDEAALQLDGATRPG